MGGDGREGFISSDGRSIDQRESMGSAMRSGASKADERSGARAVRLSRDHAEVQGERQIIFEGVRPSTRKKKLISVFRVRGDRSVGQKKCRKELRRSSVGKAIERRTPDAHIP